MGSIIDLKWTALRGQGFTGAMSDMTLQWLHFNGAISNSIPSAWREMLVAKGIPAENYQRNDAWFTVLGEAGFDVGALNDREYSFWEAGGVFP